ncbi:PREDICTED: uncharacterized protein LOC109167449 [Ipomoea nil]|uniref:uncharacterized protein LOC109167449 n=1 Tax=Ipomoea nil TaxID=35883 RepID=UPI000900B1C5|nr:PREDICTED: uncharacterized protein LOC109167449 [Ipomoea nil]
MSEASIAMKRFSSNNKASSFREFSAAYAATSGLLPISCSNNNYNIIAGGGGNCKQLHRSSSSAAASRRLLPRRSVEFPTSPQPNNGGEEMVHSSHAKHPLVEMTLPELFTCSGCKEYGAGKRYACQQCNFQLHDFCALSPPSLNTHPLHGQHQLLFHDKPKQVKSGITRAKCDVCGKSTKGFTFRCRACSFQMHPCCAMLSTEIKYPPHAHRLKLLPPSSGLQGSPAAGDQHGHAAAVSCGKCGKKRAGRVYGCTACDYHLHAVCAKEMMNGLQENGINPPEKPSVLGTAVKIAGQVVFEFIGGLIDGIGEGVGEAIVQNISGGRGSARIRAT